MASIEVYVDFRIKLPDCPKAVGWKAITSQSYGQVRAIGAEVLSGLPVGMKAPTVSDGYATYGGMLKLKVTQDTLAITVLHALQPVDAEDRELPGYISFFASHAIIQRASINPSRRIVLEHTAPERNVVLLFDSAAAGAAFELVPVNINEPAWLPRTTALKLESRLWPSEAGQEFRFFIEDEEFTANNVARACGIVGIDGTVKIGGLPVGFGLPSRIGLRRTATTESMGERFLSAHSGLSVENRYRNQHVVLPRESETVAYTRTADDFLPQIQLVGSMVSSKTDWPRFNVSCQLWSADAEQSGGTEVATAYYSPDKDLWSWTINAGIDLPRYAGEQVLFVVEQLGTARELVRGLIAPKPVVTISINQPKKPWTIRASLIDEAGAQWPLPVSFALCLGSGRNVFQGVSSTSSGGIWQVSEIEGPLSPGLFAEGGYVRASVDVQLLCTILKDLCARTFGNTAKLDVSLDVDDDREVPVACDFASRQIELTTYLKLTVTLNNQEPVSLAAFLKDRKLEADYLEAIKNLLRGDR